MKYLFHITILFLFMSSLAFAVENGQIKTYEELVEAGKIYEGMDEDSIEFMDVYSPESRLKFSKDQIKDITKGGTPKSILAAALQVSFHNELFKLAIEKGSNDPLILATSIEECHGFIQEDIQLPTYCENYVQWANSLVKINLENAYSWYLLAELNYNAGKIKKALKNLQRGNKEKYFDSHYRGRFKAITETAQKLGYDFIPASILAFSNMIYIKYMLLGKKMCKTPLSEEMAKECIAMGEKIENQSISLLERLYALSIQQSANKLLKGQKPTKRLEAIKDRRKSYAIISSMEFPNYFTIPKKIWTNYFRDLIEHDEIVAMKNRAIAAEKYSIKHFNKEK